MLSRSSGVLLNISSLPSRYGIGDFGKGGRDFADLLSDMGFSVWQTLPLCPVGAGNSPYSSVSAFALNYLYVNPDTLAEDGYITAEEARSALYPGEPYSVDYDFVKDSKQRLLRLAFDRFDRSKMADFIEENAGWLDGYAKYMAGKKANNGAVFTEWVNEPDKEDMDFYRFEQFILYGQWQGLKSYVNSKGIKMFGDMPIYVSFDSADFYANPGLFLTGPDGRLTKVAGVPPDYFSADGQLWGNPLYNWEKLKDDGYDWWIKRIDHSLSLYDIVRIDHFRGFHRYWAVPAGASTAKEGAWEDGPAMELFSLVNEKFDSPAIVAEDLGTVDEGLLEFLKETGYPGMKVMQFGFDSPDSIHLPHKYLPNSVAYTGTHDNDTMLGWLWAIPMEEKLRLLEYCRFYGDNWGEGGWHSPAVRAIVTTLWQSAAGLTILPVQDMCGFGTDTRLNIPGKAEGNWQFRITEDALSKIDREFFRKINKTYGRFCG